MAILRASYPIARELDVVEYALAHANLEAGRQFRIDETNTHFFHLSAEMSMLKSILR